MSKKDGTGLERLARPMSLLAQTEQILRQAIQEGRFGGNRLPTAMELAEQLGVSRETVRKAEEALEREGLLVMYRRKGTLLQPPPLTLKKPAARSTTIGYLQAEYPSEGGEQAVEELSARMLRGAIREAGKAGCHVAVRTAPHTEMEGGFRGLVDGARLRGIVFASCGEEKLIREALGLGLPTVLLDHDLHLPKIGSVREDSVQGAELAVRHLASLGHQRIAYAHWRLSDLNPWRLEGYRKGLRELGLPRRRSWEVYAEITEPGARQAVDAVLNMRPAPTALLCFNNRLARLAIDLLRERGVRVPQDLSVMGGGGEEAPGITCHQADWAAMGRKAVQILLKSRPDAAPEHVLFPHELRKGRTTSSPSSSGSPRRPS
jgi:DNA-binding LacI/PurR family transcriptional regulator